MGSSGSRFPRRAATAVTVLLSAWVLLLSSCNSRPRAPVLRNDPVFQNDREGFRFLVPEGWIQIGRTEIPPGKVERERPLVDYYLTTGPGTASFRVSRIDLPESADLAKLLATPSFGVKKWTQTAAPEDVTVGGVPGVRSHFGGDHGNEHVAREVVHVRRGERLYFFTSLYPAKAVAMRDQFRRVVESVIWKQ
jgi:hypothetical protein